MEHVSVRQCHRTNGSSVLPKATVFMPHLSVAQLAFRLLWQAGSSWLGSHVFLQAAEDWAETSMAGMLALWHKSLIFQDELSEWRQHTGEPGTRGLWASPLLQSFMGWQELEGILGDQWVGKEVPLLDGKNCQVTLQRAHIQKGRRDGGYYFFLIELLSWDILHIPYNSLIFKGTIQWFLVYLESCVITTTIKFRTFF